MIIKSSYKALCDFYQVLISVTNFSNILRSIVQTYEENWLIYHEHILPFQAKLFSNQMITSLHLITDSILFVSLLVTFSNLLGYGHIVFCTFNYVVSMQFRFFQAPYSKYKIIKIVAFIRKIDLLCTTYSLMV